MPQSIANVFHLFSFLLRLVAERFREGRIKQQSISLMVLQMRQNLKASNGQRPMALGLAFVRYLVHYFEFETS